MPPELRQKYLQQQLFKQQTSQVGITGAVRPNAMMFNQQLLNNAQNLSIQNQLQVSQVQLVQLVTMYGNLANSVKQKDPALEKGLREMEKSVQELKVPELNLNAGEKSVVKGFVTF